MRKLIKVMIVLFCLLVIFHPNRYALLNKAIIEGDIDKVSLLISKGADVNYKDERGKTPLHIASKVGKTSPVNHAPWRVIHQNTMNPGVYDEI